MTGRYDVLSELVSAIAEVEETTAHELDLQLYDHINTDAIKILVASGHTDWELRFEIPDHTVEIRGNGDILIDDSVVRQLGWSDAATPSSEN